MTKLRQAADPFLFPLGIAAATYLPWFRSLISASMTEALLSSLERRSDTTPCAVVRVDHLVDQLGQVFTIPCRKTVPLRAFDPSFHDGQAQLDGVHLSIDDGDLALAG
jgi:hypothetical protein